MKIYVATALDIQDSRYILRFGSRRHPEPLANFDKIVGVDEWRSLIREADYVVIATPLTPQTKGLINADILRLMRSSAYLINTARGAIVDEDALLTALGEGWIAWTLYKRVQAKILLLQLVRRGKMPLC